MRELLVGGGGYIAFQMLLAVVSRRCSFKKTRSRKSHSTGNTVRARSHTSTKNVTVQALKLNGVDVGREGQGRGGGTCSQLSGPTRFTSDLINNNDKDCECSGN